MTSGPRVAPSTSVIVEYGENVRVFQKVCGLQASSHLFYLDRHENLLGSAGLVGYLCTYRKAILTYVTKYRISLK